MKINEIVDKGRKQITEIPLIPAAVIAGGAAWTAYDAYRYGKQYKAGEITKDELIKRIGTDAALTLIGGVATKSAAKVITPIVRRKNFKVIDGGGTNRKIKTKYDKFNRPLNKPTPSNNVDNIKTKGPKESVIDEYDSEISSRTTSNKWRNTGDKKTNKNFSKYTTSNVTKIQPGDTEKFVNKAGNIDTRAKTLGLTSFSKTTQADGTRNKRLIRPGGSGSDTTISPTGNVTKKKIQLKGPQSWAYDIPK